MKKLLLLGGDALLLPVIKKAKEYGIYTITCDYLPDNIAHKSSDEYVNFSTTDKEDILEWAEAKHIDGVLTFTDSGALTAAYIAEKMGLPYQCSYEAASILQDKALFRDFLQKNNFNCPHAKGYSTIEDAMKDLDEFLWPVIVKPVDSAGSKGVCKVETKGKLREAVENALKFSHKKHFIIEDFLEMEGLSCGSESFAIDGKAVFNGLYDQYFDQESRNPYVPSGEVWPSSLSASYQNELKSELQRLFSILGVRTGIFNIEFRLCKNGKLYLMEVSPRAGGNCLAEMLVHATGQNIIDAEVRKAVGLEPKTLSEAQYDGHYAILVMHSLLPGKFEDIVIEDPFFNHVIDKMILYKKGDDVRPFTGANALIGTLFLKFDSRKDLNHALVNQSDWLKIKIN